MSLHRRALVVVVGLALAASAWIAGGGTPGARAGAVAVCMATWWIAEAMPIHVTALVPLVAFPLFHVLPGDRAENLAVIARAYVDPYLFLFVGGMVLSAAMKQWGLSRRIALGILAAIGHGSARLLGGVLVATALVSMWISNTATAAMMLPIALSLLHHVEERAGARSERFGASIVLAVSYGASLGGIATVVGTPTNAQFAGFASRQGLPVDFARFALVGGGAMLLLLPLAWWILWRAGGADAPRGRVGDEVVREELAALGPWSSGERRVIVVFALAVVAWVAAGSITASIRPWLDAHGFRQPHVEAAIGLAAAAALLVGRAQGRALCGVAALRETPWSTLLLLGGSFALAAGVGGSGLFASVAGGPLGLAGMPLLGQCLVAAGVSVLLSAVASNTATIGVLLPILWNAVPPDHAPAVTFAATIACSCDFAMPAGTPPNAIVFGSGRVSLGRMARVGFVLDVVAAIVVATWCAWIVPLVV